MATNSHEGGEPSLPGHVVEDILAVPRRRILLEVLADNGGTMPLLDLATAICAREEGVVAEGVQDSQQEMVHHDIYETHLPKLTATGIVRFDSMRDSVILVEKDILAGVESQ